MSIKINPENNREYNQLNAALQELKGPAALGNIEYEQVLQKIETALDHINLQQNRPSKQLRMQMVTLLGELEKDMMRRPPSAKTAQAAAHLLLIKTDLSGLDQRLQVHKGKIGLKIGFFCDIDCVDHNGAIIPELLTAYYQKVPFITTRSLIRCDGNEFAVAKKETETLKLIIQTEKELFADESEWEIYQLGEFLVFLPLALLPEKKGREKLEALDFITDGSLKRISLTEALQEPEGKARIETFFNLFVKAPLIDKLFYMIGHGGATTVAALDQKNYLKFLDFLDTQRCRGLSISSCSSGGKSSLLNIPKENRRSFITILHSIGDLIVSEQRRNFPLYFNELTKFLELGAETVSELSKVVEAIDRGIKKEANSRIQVYFPKPAGVAGSFQAIGERQESFALTHQVCKQAELIAGGLKPKLEVKGKLQEPLVVKDKKFLEVSPLTVHVPLKVENQNPAEHPVLLSMIPGQAQHFIKSIAITGKSLDFISQTIRLYTANRYLEFAWKHIEFLHDADITVSKAFFIGSISAGAYSEPFEEVVLKITPQGGYCVYRQGDNYFYTHGELMESGNYWTPDQAVSVQITAFEHALFFKEP